MWIYVIKWTKRLMYNIEINIIRTWFDTSCDILVIWLGKIHLGGVLIYSSPFISFIKITFNIKFQKNIFTFHYLFIFLEFLIIVLLLEIVQTCFWRVSYFISHYFFTSGLHYCLELALTNFKVWLDLYCLRHSL